MAQDSVLFSTCEECGNIAEVVDWFDMESTSGPVQMLKIQCSQGHWYHRVIT